MPIEKKSIENLITEARLADAQNRFSEFLDFCETQKENLTHYQARTAFLQKEYNAGTLTRDGDIERNRITLSFLTEISDFRSKLSDYFGVGDSKEFFDKIKSRDDIILRALEPRVTDKQYLIESRLKDGNSSIVFKLKKAHTGQEAVALVLKMPELSAQTKEDYIKISELRHRNIIKLVDHELESFPFFVITEFVYGDNLTKIVAKTGTRPMAQMIDWIYQLSDALDYMRHKGIMHTNVRPSKVFVDEELNIMISPFDINKTNWEDRTFTRFQDVCLYGSPELLEQDGKPLSINEMCVSDQYSLGLIAYKILTGNDLFEGNSILEILKNRQLFSTNKTYRANKLSVFPKTVLGKIFEKLLHEDPSKRYNNLHDVVVALHAYTHKNKSTNASIVRDSYRRCFAKNKMLISDFYNLLYEKLPQVRADFENPKRQLSMMQMAVDLLIDIDEKKTILMALLTNEKHQSYTLDHFDVFIDTILEVIAKNDKQWAATELEWRQLKEKTLAVIREARGEVKPNLSE
jgi:serine/threonine protein kinase